MGAGADRVDHVIVGEAGLPAAMVKAHQSQVSKHICIDDSTQLGGWVQGVGGCRGAPEETAMRRRGKG